MVSRFVYVSLILLSSVALLLRYDTAFGQTAQSDKPVSVKWLTFGEALERSKTDPRKIFVDVYTDWCGWCKVMDKKTFSNPLVAKMLNEQFYPVKFNAEQLEDVNFKGNTYRFIPQGNRGYHQFAALLLNNKMSYPTVVILDESLSNSYPIPGYRTASDFYPFLVFFADNYHKKGGENPWGDFQKTYKSPF